MSFFDDSHVTNVGLRGSAGPTVGFGEMFSQAFQQQFRVDSARAFDDELRNRWLESLRAAQVTGGDVDPDDPWAYRAFSQHVKGQPIDTFDPNKTLWDYDPTKRIKGMIDANEKIKALNNPEIKSFEQILEEVAQMQHEVEGETASMYERSSTGGFVASLLGAIGGSFTTRDPLNIITAPIGAGRTVATRIAAEMGIAGAVVGYTELAEVAPARQIAGLPERDPLFNIAAATLGAGVIRGGIEGVGYGLRRLRGEDIDFDLRDSQLAQMFEANADKPSARAGLAVLDDTKFIERNNPYGEGYQANTRFLAELQAVQRAMNGEPMTAVARVLPPIPYESLKKAADFEIVREQAPELYARMEATQVRVRQLEEQVRAVSGGTPKLDFKKDNPGGEWLARKIVEAEKDYAPWKEGIRAKGLSGATTGFGRVDLPVGMLKGLRGVNNEDVRASGKLDEIVGSIRESGYDPKSRVMVWINHKGEAYLYEGNHRVAAAADAGVEKIPVEVQWRNGAEDLPGDFSPDALRQFGGLVVDREALVKSRLERRAATAEYQAAYRAVEAEAARINKQQIDAEAMQQRDAVNILASQGLPFIGPLLRRDSVAELVDRINTFNDGLDERTAAKFVRESIGEGEDKIEVEVWEKDGGIDIGLRDPVDPKFTFMTDEGEMTVAQAMRDLQDDTDLVEAIKGCAI